MTGRRKDCGATSTVDFVDEAEGRVVFLAGVELCEQNIAARTDHSLSRSIVVGGQGQDVRALLNLKYGEVHQKG